MESHGEQHMSADLKLIYEMLISPVADLLVDMKPNDKLIIVAPEVCDSVYNNAKTWSRSLVCVDLLQLKTCNTWEFHIVPDENLLLSENASSEL